MPKLKVNGRTQEVAVPDDTPLLYVLRNDLKLNGPKWLRPLAMRLLYRPRRWAGCTLLRHAGWLRHRTGHYHARGSGHFGEALQIATGLH